MQLYYCGETKKAGELRSTTGSGGGGGASGSNIISRNMSIGNLILKLLGFNDFPLDEMKPSPLKGSLQVSLCKPKIYAA